MTLQVILVLYILFNEFWGERLGPYSNRRNNRDCRKVIETINIDTGINLTCITEAGEKDLDIESTFYESNICLDSSPEPVECQPFSCIYRAYTLRDRSSSNIPIAYDSIACYTFQIGFGHAATLSQSPPSKYTACVMSYSGSLDGRLSADCLCEVCENGIDFKYNCNGVNDPTVEPLCVPIQSIMPTNFDFS